MESWPANVNSAPGVLFLQHIALYTCVDGGVLVPVVSVFSSCSPAVWPALCRQHGCTGVCTHLYVCVHACVHVGVCACVQAHICAIVLALACVCVPVFVCTCAHVHVCVCMHMCLPMNPGLLFPSNRASVQVLLGRFHIVGWFFKEFFFFFFLINHKPHNFLILSVWFSGLGCNHTCI